MNDKENIIITKERIEEERRILTHKEIENMDPKTMKVELRRANAVNNFYQSVVDEIIDTVVITSFDGKILHANRAYEELSGLKEEEIIGKHLSELEGTYISESSGLEAIRTGKEVKKEIKFLKTNRTAFVVSKPFYDSDGDLSHILSNSRNFREIERLKLQLDNAFKKMEEYKEEIDAIGEQLNQDHGMVVADQKMINLLTRAKKAAKVDTTVLVLGETGVGKEELARYLHRNSRRKDGRFITVNCGAISSQLIESELFGYEKGAFTGAVSTGKKGYFEVADRGVLFLDEVGELSLDMQVKLLRVLQEQEITPVGGTDPIKIDVKVIAATNKDLEILIEEKKFRMDLYYRLNVISLKIPPLRERPDDIVPIAKRFLDKINKKYSISKTISRDAYVYLKGYSWPGNVRELRNVIEQSVIMADHDIVFLEDLSISEVNMPQNDERDSTVNLNEILEKLEYEYMVKAYATHGTIRAAASALAMNYSTFERKKKKYEQQY